MILEKIRGPEDLRRFLPEELPVLAEEIRARIIQVTARTGGHLASSLGVVELAIALHYCLNTPRDKIIWDVGHQAYAHKILTGRNVSFENLRQYQGLTGFPCKDESEFDPFTTGHSSTAISLALGLVCARDLLPPEGAFRVAAVIGDGSLSGGLCFEGLNNAGHLKKDMLVVLNTNELSIAPNVGALSTYLNKIISQPLYNRFKNSLDHFIEARIPRGSRLLALANKFEEGLKGLFVPGMFFEELGFRYFGPFDGHNLSAMIATLRNILATAKGPVLFHAVTKKGKGYVPAEKDPVRFHSAPPFEIASGAPRPPKKDARPSYTAVFGKKLVSLARSDERIVAITAAMPEGTGLSDFRDAFPKRFFDVGIAEGHAVSFAGGLARQGMRPVVAIYSTFLQRAYDHIVECVALQNVPVVFVIDRAGVVGEDGATHQGAFDLAFLRSIPHMVVMVPSSGAEMEQMLAFAFTLKRPVALRYPKAAVPEDSFGGEPLELGKAEALTQGREYCLFAAGSMVEPAVKAAEALRQEGIRGTVVNGRFVKPLDADALKTLAADAPILFSAEDGVVAGGFGSALQEALQRPVTAFGLPDAFLPCGNREVLLNLFGLSAPGLAEQIKRHLKESRR